MSENDIAQNGANFANESANYLTPDEFAKLVGTERQTVSYHLRKGLLARWVESGRILTEPYRIPDDLVDWYLSQKGVKAAKVYAQKPAPLPQVNAQAYAPPAQTYAPNDALTAKVLELADKVMAQADEIAKTKTELEAKRSEIAILNNERANYNTKLQKASEDARDNAYLRGELEATRRERDEFKQRLEALEAKPPSWMFWKK